MILTVHTQNPEPRAIRKAAEVLAAGGIVVYPTDTVYGLGCSVLDKAAIERIYLIKKQRTDRPFSFVCSDLTHISEYATVDNAAFKIMKHLIPGPYTFILPAGRMKNLPKLLLSKRKTVGIRVPDSATTLGIVRELGHPILSTSATGEGGAVLRDSSEMIATYRNSVELILDAGPLTSDQSTVLDLTGDEPVVIRQGSGDTSFLL
jgi:tRNA threonylcarbamoyl adenosine modification protein (Sua5/YciO/YrdC/YwlC family)